MTIQIGDKVKVLDNAFGDSTHPHDIAARGLIGRVIGILGDNGEIEVQTEDDDFLLLAVDEVEVIEE